MRWDSACARTGWRAPHNKRCPAVAWEAIDTSGLPRARAGGRARRAAHGGSGSAAGRVARPHAAAPASGGGRPTHRLLQLVGERARGRLDRQLLRLGAPGCGSDVWWWGGARAWNRQAGRPGGHGQGQPGVRRHALGTQSLPAPTRCPVPHQAAAWCWLTQRSGRGVGLQQRHRLGRLPAEGQEVAALGGQARVRHCVQAMMQRGCLVGGRLSEQQASSSHRQALGSTS